MPSCSRNRKRHSRKQLGGSAVFPATFGGFDNHVRNYELNTYGGEDPSYNQSSRLLGGGKGRNVQRKQTRRTRRRRGNKKMRGGNFIGGLTPLNLTLGGNPVMNSGGSFMGVGTMK